MKRSKNYILFLTIFYFVLIFTSCSKKGNDVIVPEKKIEIKGADISFLPEIRQSGKTFYNSNNQPEDIIQTLKKAGVNTVRLRLWKNPAEPNSNFENVKNITNEAKSLGLKVMITVHYSDTWADPSKQAKPLQWQNVDYNSLLDSVSVYTKKIVAEINPDYISIGNEINNGFLWPEGSISNLLQMKSLLRKAISAVRQTNINTKIIIHYAGFENANTFYSNLTDLDFDIIGLSYYPMWHGKNLDALQQSLKTISQIAGKPIFIAETSYPFTLGWNDWTNNVIGLDTQILPEFSATPQGQKDYLNKLIEIIKDVPNGIGFCYWGGEWVSYKGNNATNGSSWENQAFWDFDNHALPVLDAYLQFP
jgi:arabinogalactan endo-1,4-beta-galactosidase